MRHRSQGGGQSLTSTEPVLTNQSLESNPITAELLWKDEQLPLVGGSCELPDSPGAVPLPVLSALSSKATQRGTGGSPCHQLLWDWVHCDCAASMGPS